MPNKAPLIFHDGIDLFGNTFTSERNFDGGEELSKVGKTLGTVLLSVGLIIGIPHLTKGETLKEQTQIAETKK